MTAKYANHAKKEADWGFPSHCYLSESCFFAQSPEGRRRKSLRFKEIGLARRRRDAEPETGSIRLFSAPPRLHASRFWLRPKAAPGIWRPVRLRSGQDFAVESLCLVPEATLGPLCPGGEDSCETKPIPAAGIPHYSTILSFHHSAPNKPNFRLARRKDKCRVDKELRRMGHGRGCGKTNPISGSRPLAAVVLGPQTRYIAFGYPLMGARAHATGHTAASPRLRGDDIATNRASAPNKPNFGAGDLEDKCRVNKELRPIGYTSGPRKTKPIQEKFEV